MSIDPVTVSVVVEREPEDAFALFTEHTADWWPMAAFSVGGEHAKDVVLEGRTGGRIFERTDDGEEHDWGRITTWEPPVRLAVAWHPGGDPETPTEWDATFEAEGDGRTRVTLVHSGWERLGDRGPQMREAHVSGWQTVLEPYVAAGAEQAGAR